MWNVEKKMRNLAKYDKRIEWEIRKITIDLKKYWTENAKGSQLYIIDK